MKKISVIIPAFNEESTITKSITSLVNQKLKPLEIIVVDDKSTDNTISVVIDLIEKFKEVKIRLLKHNFNQGAAKARNSGLKEALGEYVFFAEADGEYCKFYLKRCAENIKENSFTSGGLRVCANNNSIWRHYWNSLFEARWYISKYYKKTKGGWFFNKKDLLKVGGYNELLREGEDVDLTNRLNSLNISSNWISNIFFRHNEPDSFKRVFNRFFTAGKNTITFRKKEKNFIKHSLFSLILLLFLPLFIFFNPILIFINKENKIAFSRVVKKSIRGQIPKIMIILFPLLFLFQKSSTALGIIVGTFYLKK